MHSKILRGSIFLAALGGLAASTALAQNPAYAPGDLILAFQNPGGAQGADQVVLLRLGDTATTFRDATSNLINIANLGSTLTSTYGANWWEADTLYMGLVGVWGTNNISTTLQNQDPHRTVYLSRPRGAVGVEGIAESTPPSVANSTDATAGASNANTVGNGVETQGTTALNIFTTANTSYDQQNPVDGNGLQGTAYTVFSGGLQDRFEVGAFGTFGGVAGVEGAVDLYRVQARNNINGQYGFGSPNFVGEFQGTVVINQSGDVSFIVQPVPEPSTTALLGLASAAAFGLRRRRPATA